MKKLPIIPDLPAVQLRDLANKVAREDGYRVRALPTVVPDRSALMVTFMASDGLTFPGFVPATRLIKFLETLPRAQ